MNVNEMNELLKYINSLYDVRSRDRTVILQEVKITLTYIIYSKERLIQLKPAGRAYIQVSTMS